MPNAQLLLFKAFLMSRVLKNSLMHGKGNLYSYICLNKIHLEMIPNS